jgi:hypothetical protein
LEVCGDRIDCLPVLAVLLKGFLHGGMPVENSAFSGVAGVQNDSNVARASSSKLYPDAAIMGKHYKLGKHVKVYGAEFAAKHGDSNAVTGWLYGRNAIFTTQPVT